MRTTRLGNTDIEVSAIGFGAMHLSLAGRPSEKQAHEVVHRALALGVTLIDTADAYCRDENDKHHNERLIREALRSYGGDVAGCVVATKGGYTRPGGSWEARSDPDYLRRTIRESYIALGESGPIALWQHHAPDQRVSLEDSLAVVKEAVDEGLIRYVGVSNYSVEEIERARKVVDVVSVQNEYSPWHRESERNGVLSYCEREGLTFLPWSPLGGGGRAKRLGDYPDLAALAREKGVSPQRLVLAWLRAKSPCVLPIPGASRVATLEDSVAAAELELSSDEVERIDRATA